VVLRYQKNTLYNEVSHTDSSTYIEIEDNKFEKVNSFTYLGSEINSKNFLTPEIRKRITAANKCFNGLRKFMKSGNIRKDSKLLIYISLIRTLHTFLLMKANCG